MSFKIEIVQGDITKAKVEVIVNAANNHFWMGSGVAGAIKNAGGEIIEKEAVKKGPKLPGQSVYTIAGNLPHKLVIHAAVMGQDLKTTDKYIRQATLSSIKLADELKINSIALPAFGTGVGDFPMKACANLMIKTSFGFQTMSNNLRLVQFCLYDKYGYSIFKEILERELLNR